MEQQQSNRITSILAELTSLTEPGTVLSKQDAATIKEAHTLLDALRWQAIAREQELITVQRQLVRAQEDLWSVQRTLASVQPGAPKVVAS